MEANAYVLGNLDASLEYGLSKTAYASAVLPALGALSGYALAPEGEEGRGAMLGGLGALGLQSAVSGPGKAHVAPAPAAAPAAPPAHAPVSPTAFSLQNLENLIRASAAQGKQDLHKYLFTTPHPKLAQFKVAFAVGGSIPIPGMGGLGLSVKDQKDRLPGMGRWVPREVIERGFEQVGEGFSPEDVVMEAEDSGSIKHPLIGAALAAASAARFAPKSGIGGALLAGLGGAGLGSLYNRATKDDRVRDSLEGFSGAQTERTKFPIQKQVAQTANESAPMTVHRGLADA